MSSAPLEDIPELLSGPLKVELCCSHSPFFFLTPIYQCLTHGTCLALFFLLNWFQGLCTPQPGHRLRVEEVALM